ncbi:hypothetical protein BCAR13_770014 [Paraburkholderia caribensis]|nr:hypothetical protein BCAR13_770014 [Paraburkholderia caribensis]
MASFIVFKRDSPFYVVVLISPALTAKSYRSFSATGKWPHVRRLYHRSVSIRATAYQQNAMPSRSTA